MTMKNLYLLLLPLLAMSCSKYANEVHIVSSDVPETSIEFAPYTPLNELIEATFIDNVPGGILATNLYSTDYSFSYYDMTSDKITHFGRNGRGPNEFLTPMYYRQHDPNNENMIWIHDHNLHKIDLTKINTPDLTVKTIELKRMYGKVFYINDTTVIGPLVEENCPFIIENTITRTLKTLEPTLDFNISHRYAQSLPTYDHKNNRIIMTYLSRGQIDVVDTDDYSIISYFIDKVPTMAEIEKEFFGFGNAKCYGDNVYVRTVEPNENNELNNCIWVFDNDFNAITKIKLPSGVADFMIKADKIYITRDDQEEHPIWIANLPKFD